MGVETLYRVRKKELKKASLVLGTAFQNDPHFVLIMPDPDYRREKIHHLFRCIVNYGIIYGEVYSPSPGIEAVSVWLRSKDYNLTEGRLIRSGFFRLLWQVDKETLNRFREYGEEMERMHRESAPYEYWYLWALGASPELQKKGLASKMLRAMLERIDKERLPCWLETNGDINESIYEKFGFEVVKRASALGEPGCGMLRYPF